VLEYQKVKLLEQYARHILKLDTFLLKVVGYNPEESRLKIDDYLLHCSPAAISLQSCSLVLFLGKNEIDFFKKFEKKLVSLNLAFDSTYFGSPVSFYIKGRMESINVMRENVYMLDFTLTNIPETYKEIFLYLSNISSLYKKLYNTKLTENQKISINKIPIDKVQIFKDGVLVCHGRIASLSNRHIELDLRHNQVNLEMDKTYKYTILYYGRGINLTGKIVKSLPYQFISSLDFNLEYIHIISKYMNISNQIPESEFSEELEEL